MAQPAFPGFERVQDPDTREALKLVHDRINKLFADLEVLKAAESSLEATVKALDTRVGDLE